MRNIFLTVFLLFAGEICGGHCCDNKTETDVLRKSVKVFEGLIKHQLKSLKGLWESSYSTYKGKAFDINAVAIKCGKNSRKFHFKIVLSSFLCHSMRLILHGGILGLRKELCGPEAS
jgi:hypothetical protein